MLLRDQIPQRQVVHYILGLLDGVLDRVDPLAENIVFEVEDLEAGVQILDEAADLNGQGRVAQRDAVHRQAAEVVDHADQPEEVILDGDVKHVIIPAGFEVDGCLQDLTDGFEREQVARDVWGRRERRGAEPGGQEEGGYGVLQRAGVLVVVFVVRVFGGEGGELCD